jgi:CMP-N,N'-diacetyllegionaminic acid synthase
VVYVSTLAIIPARAGSKGIPGKNKRLICGHPLVYWTIVAAQEARRLDEIVVSTDDEEIAEIARGLGISVPFMRPPELALDDTPGNEPILHALQLMEDFDSVVVLQPTSPLRTSADIDAIVELAAVQAAVSAVSVCVTKEPVEWTFTVQDDGTLTPLATGERAYRRQDAQMTHTLNGALYYFETPWFLAGKTFIDDGTVAYIMPPERSIDIDTALDWTIAEFLLGKTV